MSKYADKHMIHTDRYKPARQQCCEACVFGKGEHAEFCKIRGYASTKSEVAKIIGACPTEWPRYADSFLTHSEESK
jgi:hypothetical protein